MSEEVAVEFGDSASDTAVLLLAAAQELDLPADVVRVGNGEFLVPEEVAKKAKSDSAPPAKKAAAKKSAK